MTPPKQKKSFFPGEVEDKSQESNDFINEVHRRNPFMAKGLTKLAEISSGDNPQSQKRIEMYYKDPELGAQEMADSTHFKAPKVTSIVSNELDLERSFRNLGLDLISLPDQKDYRGSWRILFRLQNNDIFEDKIEAKFINSERHLNRKKLPEFLEDISDQKQMTSNKVIKIVAMQQSQSGTQSQSHGSWLYSDSSASQVVKLNLMNDKGEEVPVLNEQQVEFYKELYNDILKVERGEKKPAGSQFPIDFNPKEAMVVLNESFKLAESAESNGLGSSRDVNNLNPAAGRKSHFNEKSFLPTKTLRGYTRKLTKQPTMFSRNSVFNEDKDRRKSKLSMDDRKSHKTDNSAKSTPQRRPDKDEPKEASENKSADFSLSGDSEEAMALESEEEEADRVKVVINLTREIWMSLRMAPVLSYAPQIRESIESLGFKIKFIEDLVVMNEEYKQLVQRKIEEINRNSINNVRFSRFNRMGFKKLKTLDNRNLPQDRRGLKDMSISNNTVSLDQKKDPLEMMNQHEMGASGESLRIVSYYHVKGQTGEGDQSMYFKGVAKGKKASREQQSESNVRGETDQPARQCASRRTRHSNRTSPSTTSCCSRTRRSPKTT